MESIKNRIVEALKTLFVFRGTFEERKEKYQELHRVAIAGASTENIDSAIELTTIDLEQTQDGNVAGSSGTSHYNPLHNKIVMIGHLSLITYLHELAHALAIRDEKEAQEFACDIFSRAYPKSFARLQRVGDTNLLVKGEFPPAKPFPETPQTPAPEAPDTPVTNL